MHFRFTVKVSGFLLLITLFPLGTLCAQQTDTLTLKTLEDVEVVERARRNINREAVPVQLMDQADFERLGLQELSDALKRFSGVTVKDYGGIGGLKTVSVRSLGAQHTAVSYDGITISDIQSGQVDISRFSLDNVESVTLSIGQTDDIFETARMYASAGALSIRTENPEFGDKNHRIKGQVKAGSFGWVNTILRFDRKLSDHYTFSLLGDWSRADGQYKYTYANGDSVIHGKRKNSDVKSFRTEANLYADWKTAGKLRVKGYWYDSRRGLPGNITYRTDYQKERLWNKNGFVQGVYENDLSRKISVKGQLKYDYGWTRYQDFHSSYIDGHQTDIYKQKEYYISGGVRYNPAEHLYFSLAEDFFINKLDATTPECPFPKRYTSLTAIAGQYKNSRLTATVSLLNTYIKEELQIGDPADDRKRLSPAFSASYRLLNSQNLRIRASYKDIFRTPTFNDLYYDRIGNKELESEKAKQWNLGLTWSGNIQSVCLDYLSISIDGYYNQVKDKIVALPTMFIWKMMNMGKVNIKGLDVNLSSRFVLPSSLYLQVDGNYTWQDATDATEKGSKIYGHQIPYTPVHAGNLSVSLENPWVNVSWIMNAVGERYSLAQNSATNRIDSYIEQQLSFSRDFRLKKCDIRLHAEIINLGNINYDVIRFYPMPGRSFRTGIQLVY